MFRLLNENDIPSLIEIEKNVQVLPWPERFFAHCFQMNCIGWGLQEKNKLIGFIIISFILDEAHILNFAIDLPWQKKGLGYQLLHFSLNKIKQSSISRIWLEVRVSNQPAISLYQKVNFICIGKRKAYYPGVSEREDALVFMKEF